MGDDLERRIKELESEITRLREELKKTKQRELDLEDTRKAMLYMLEDLNETTEAILRAKKEWETTFDCVSSPMFIHDREFRVVRCNKAYRDLTGLPFEMILNKPYFELFPRRDGPFDMCKMAVDTSEYQERAEEVFIPETNRFFRMHSYPVTDEKGNYMHSIHILDDITEDKREEERRKALYDFTQRITKRLDLDFRLVEICRTVLQMGYGFAWAGILDEKTKRIIRKGWAGNGRDGVDAKPLPSDYGTVEAAIKSKNTVIRDNLSDDLREDTGGDGRYRSVATFPVIYKESVLGVLCAYTVYKRFPQEDVEFLQGFANQLSFCIKNSLLYDEVRKSEKRIREERDITSNLLIIADATARTTDLGRLMNQVVHSVQRIMRCDICISYIWETETHLFRPCEGAGLHRDMVPFFRTESLSLDIPFIKRAMEGGSVIEKVDLKDLDYRTGTYRWMDNTDTVAVIPLTGREGYLGVLICTYRASNRRIKAGFTDRDFQIMKGIASQVSIALEEARIYKASLDKSIELSRKIETIQTMHEIDRSILSSLEPQEILETSTRMVSKIVYCDSVMIELVDEEKKGFIYTAGFGLESFKKGVFIPFEDTIAVRVIETLRPQLFTNMEEIDDPLPVERELIREGFLSYIRMPIVVKGEGVGVLCMGAKRRAAFTPEDVSTIEKLAFQVGVALENARLLEDLEELFIGTVRTLSNAIDAKSPWTKGHAERVTYIAIEIGREMGLSERELKDLELAGLLHDIGKIGIYETILDKPEKLTEEELHTIREHPVKGAEILEPIRQLKRIIPAIKYHHEFYNGEGYPEGLKGEDIPLMARILAVADTVDAMGSDRPYRKGKSMDEIVTELKRCSGTQFDPEVVRAFLKTLKRFKKGGLSLRHSVV